MRLAGILKHGSRFGNLNDITRNDPLVGINRIHLGRRSTESCEQGHKHKNSLHGHIVF